MASGIKWTGIKEYKDKLISLQKAKTQYEKEYLKILENLTLKMIKQAAPKDTGEYANSWTVVQRGAKFIVIDTSMPDLFNWLENGTRPHKIRAKSTDFLSFGGIFRKEVDHMGTQPQPHIIHVVDQLDKIMKDVMHVQMKKHYRLFNHISTTGGVPKTSNLTKTVGLTGTKVSSLRGRGKITMVRARTGRKQFKRRLGRRRRTGQWIKRAQAN